MASLFSDNPQLGQALGETFSKVWKPALAGAAVAGAGTGYLASRDPGHERETQSERRRRILRSALIGAGLGGTAMAAIPMGAAMFNTPAQTGGIPDPTFTDKLISAPGNALQSTAGGISGMAGGLIGGAIPGVLNIPGNRKARSEAINELGKLLSDAHLSPMDSTNPKFFTVLEREGIIKNLAKEKGHTVPFVRNLFREAGVMRGEALTGGTTRSFLRNLPGSAKQVLLQNRLNPFLRKSMNSARLHGWGQLALVLAGGALGQKIQDTALPS